MLVKNGKVSRLVVACSILNWAAFGIKKIEAIAKSVLIKTRDYNNKKRKTLQ